MNKRNVVDRKSFMPGKIKGSGGRDKQNFEAEIFFFRFFYFDSGRNRVVFFAENILMNSIGIRILMICACAWVLSGCAGMSSGGKNPWAPPEKKKPAAERWEEKATAEKKEDSAANAVAEKLPAVTVAESHEVAEIVFSDNRMAVAYRLGGIRVPVQKGEFFALRTKELKLSGIVRLDVLDGETLGFELVAGTASVGDLVTIPGTRLREEMKVSFPGVLPPEPAAN